MIRTKREQGEEIDKDGKTHNISRETCAECFVILSEYHYNCCGFTRKGFDMGIPHVCTKS